MLTVVGGTYCEECIDPQYYELYGSGLRAAAALSERIGEINLRTCIGNNDTDSLKSICKTFGINCRYTEILKTVSFLYYHPLSSPEIFPNNIDNSKIELPNVDEENILYYGLIEANVKVNGSYVVYDPQSGISFKETGSTAKNLALVLNKKEALLLSGFAKSASVKEVGEYLLQSEKAEVVIIKNGSYGSIVIEKTGVKEIPVFKTSSVWPMGSGDIFSAVFAEEWILKKNPAATAALVASRFTAQYCQNNTLPLSSTSEVLLELPKQVSPKKIYLAGPFFTIAERWLINEVHNALSDFGNEVFSPYHDVGLEDFSDRASKDIATKDLIGLQEAEVVLAVVSGMDPGTLFEIGFARALGKKVVILAENVHNNDLTMLIGSNCEITNDLSTAIYMASW